MQTYINNIAGMEHIVVREVVSHIFVLWMLTCMLHQCIMIIEFVLVHVVNWVSYYKVKDTGILQRLCSHNTPRNRCELHAEVTQSRNFASALNVVSPVEIQTTSRGCVTFLLWLWSLWDVQDFFVQMNYVDHFMKSCKMLANDWK